MPNRLIEQNLPTTGSNRFCVAGPIGWWGGRQAPGLGLNQLRQAGSANWKNHPALALPPCRPEASWPISRWRSSSRTYWSELWPVLRTVAATGRARLYARRLERGPRDPLDFAGKPEAIRPTRQARKSTVTRFGWLKAQATAGSHAQGGDTLCALVAGDKPRFKDLFHPGPVLLHGSEPLGRPEVSLQSGP